MAFTRHMDTLPAAARRGVEEIAASGDVTFVLLFGSRARGNARPDSDVDIAVMTNGRLADAAGWKLRHIPRLSGPDAPADLVVLDDASYALRFRAARDGLPLWVSDERALHDFRVAAHRDWLDFEPMLRVHDEALRRRIADGSFAGGNPGRG